ncbi:MAG: restriction endonuclease subunit S, partial [Treponema sp.]
MQSGGEWKEVEIQDLFEIVGGSQPNTNNRCEKKEDGMVNTITGATSNNGICFYSYAEKSLENELTIAKDGEYAGTVFLQTERFIIGGHFLGIIAKEKMSNKAKLYIASLINQMREIWKGYDRPSVSKKRLESLKITIPFINGKICFSYMEKFVEEMENEYIKDLETDRMIKFEAY